MYDFARFKPLHIPVDETTVAEQLKSAGYQTMFAGNLNINSQYDVAKSSASMRKPVPTSIQLKSGQ